MLRMFILYLFNVHSDGAVPVSYSGLTSFNVPFNLLMHRLEFGVCNDNNYSAWTGCKKLR
jgi:hypothetical protein